MRLTIIHRIYKSEAESLMAARGSDVVGHEMCYQHRNWTGSVSTAAAVPACTANQLTGLHPKG